MQKQQGAERDQWCGEGSARKHEVSGEEEGREGGEEDLAWTEADVQPSCLQVEEPSLHPVGLTAVCAGQHKEAVACGCQQASQSPPCHSLLHSGFQQGEVRRTVLR